MEGSLKDVECGTHIHIQVLVTDTIFSRPIHKYCTDYYRGRRRAGSVSNFNFDGQLQLFSCGHVT